MKNNKTTSFARIILGIALILFAVWSTVAILAVIRTKTPTLHVYNWSEYIDPDVIAKFEDTFECKVVIDTFPDNETLLAKLMSGASGYDVIFPSSYIVPVLVKNGLIRKINVGVEDFPNVVRNIDNKYKHLFHPYMMSYTVPYALSLTGIAYRKDVVDPSTPMKRSWDDLKNPSFKGRVSTLFDIREMLGIGLLMNGKSINTRNSDDIAMSVGYLAGLKKYICRMDSEQYRTGLSTGEILACVAYSSDIFQLIIDGDVENVEFFVPDEGSTCCWDEMAIPTKCSNFELAKEFIDFLYIQQIAAMNMPYICATVPNSGIWDSVGEEYRGNDLINVSPEVLSKVTLIEDVGSDIEKYNSAWDTITLSSK